MGRYWVDIQIAFYVESAKNANDATDLAYRLFGDELPYFHVEEAEQVYPAEDNRYWIGATFSDYVEAMTIGDAREAMYQKYYHWGFEDFAIYGVERV